MKKVIALALALVMALSLVACGSTKTEGEKKTKLVLGTSADYAPFEFIVLNDKNEQEYVGVDISVAKAIAEDMGMELEVVNMNFDNLMAALQKGDVDVVLAAIEDTPEREVSGDFSDPYYTDQPPMILVKADKASEYATLDAFAGKSVGAQTGTTKSDLVTEKMPGANLVGLTTVTDMVNQLVYDKVDAIVLDGAVALQYAQTNTDLAVSAAALGEAAPYCVAVQKGDPSKLLDSINATIAKLIADGSIDQYCTDADALSDKAIDG
jgi:ABC-type amino acid transport substrate-binding protein